MRRLLQVPLLIRDEPAQAEPGGQDQIFSLSVKGDVCPFIAQGDHGEQVLEEGEPEFRDQFDRPRIFSAHF